MPTTLKDLAQTLNLSISTISRVLNGKGAVSEQTRNRILKTASEMNYSANEYARSLKTQKYNSIALMVPSVINPYYNSIIQSIEEKSRSENCALLIGVSNYNIERADYYIRFLASHRVTGLIVATNDKSAFFEELRKNGIRLLSLNQHREDSPIDWIAIDNAAAMSDLTQYILNLGHSNLACLYATNGGENLTASLRYKGFLDCMRRNGLEVAPQLTLDAGLYYETGRVAAQQLLCCSPMPTAILCHNNSIAVAVYDVLTEAGLRIPEDVSIACFDAIIPNDVVATRFTCIIQPTEQIAFEAVNRILHADQYPDGGQGFLQKVFPYRLVIGDTTCAHRK